MNYSAAECAGRNGSDGATTWELDDITATKSAASHSRHTIQLKSKSAIFTLDRGPRSFWLWDNGDKQIINNTNKQLHNCYELDFERKMAV